MYFTLYYCFDFDSEVKYQEWYIFAQFSAFSRLQTIINGDLQNKQWKEVARQTHDFILIARTDSDMCRTVFSVHLVCSGDNESINTLIVVCVTSKRNCNIAQGYRKNKSISSYNVTFISLVTL